jgi:RimJ/RimL family protein N-acetyltransferase
LRRLGEGPGGDRERIVILYKRIFYGSIPARMEMGNIRLRPLRISDGAFLKSGFSEEENLRASGLSTPVSASGAAIRRWIKKTYDLAWCIEIDSLPAGFAGVCRLRPGESAEAGLMLFDKALRRRGYGRSVFVMISEALTVSAGIKKLAVRVLKNNLAALSFWKGIGFADAGCEDGICRMEIELTPGTH